MADEGEGAGAPGAGAGDGTVPDTGVDGVEAAVAEAIAKGEIPEDGGPAPEDGTQLAAEDLAGLHVKAQEKVNQRIAELVARAKSAEEARAQAEAKAAELAAKGPNPETVAAALKLNLAPEYFRPEELADIQKVERLKVERAWLREHADGYEGKDEKNDPSWTPAQVRECLDRVEEEYLTLAPKTKGLVTERQKQLLADAAIGRRIREGIRAGKKPAAPPKLPEQGKAGSTPPVSAGRTRRPGFDSDEFRKAGPSPKSLRDQYEKMFA